MMFPFLGPLYNTAPTIQGTQKGNHDFDNHPYEDGHIDRLGR